jgi:alginate O-acetyltransferase complex protein AlgI
MAIGLGHMFGFIFPENFNYPYISRSISEFWRRWHMTLSGWFRDYLFYPLLRSRGLSTMARRLKKGGHKAASRTVPTIIALVIVWFSTGLWHGANWNYVLWGLYYGFWLILEQFVTDKYMKKLPNVLSAIIGHIGSIIIILFGYAIFYHEKDLFVNLGRMIGIGVSSFSSVYATSMIYENGILLMAAIFCCTPLGHLAFEKLRNMMKASLGEKKAYNVDRIIKTVLVIVLLGICSIRLVGDSYNPFIYFKF